MNECAFFAPAIVLDLRGKNAVDTPDQARSAFDKLGTRPRRVALVIPDTAAKVSLLRFDKVPAAVKV